MDPTLVEVPLAGLRGSATVLLGAAAMLSLIGAALAMRGRDRVSAGLLTVLAVSALVGLAALRGGTVSLGALQVRSFGALLFAGMLVGGVLLTRAAERLGFDRHAVEAALVGSVVCGLVAARAGYVLLNLPAYPTLADSLAVERGGLSGTLGLWAGVGAGAAVLHRRQVSIATVADAAVRPMLVLWVGASVGAYLAGSDLGVPLATTAPRWLARIGTFDRWPTNEHPMADGPPVLLEQIARGLVTTGADSSLPVHAVPLYSAIFALALFAAAPLARRAFASTGQTALAAIVLYGAWLFAIDGLRADSDRGILSLGAQPAWLLPVGVGALGIAAVAALRRGSDRAGFAGPSRAVTGLAVLATAGAFMLGRRLPAVAVSVPQLAGWLAGASALAVLALARRVSTVHVPTVTGSST